MKIRVSRCPLPHFLFPPFCVYLFCADLQAWFLLLTRLFQLGAHRFSIGTGRAELVCVCVCRIVAERFGSESKILPFSQMKRWRRRAVMSCAWLRCLCERRGGILCDRIDCFGSGGNAAVEGIGVCANWLRRGERAEKKRWLKAASICLEPNCPCLPSQLVCSESESWAFYPFTAL